MTATNDFLAFAAAGGANVVSQSTYAGGAVVGPGFVSGIAPSNVCNKAWRQSSIMAAVLAQVMANMTGQSSVDDGTTSTLISNLLSTMALAGYAADTGSANSYQVNLSGAINVYDGLLIRFRPAHANTGASTLSVNGSSATAIVNQAGGALTANDIVANGDIMVEWNATENAWVIYANSYGYQHSVTPSAGDNTTKVATTAFVAGAVGSITSYGSFSNAGATAHSGGSNLVTGSHTGTGTYRMTFSTAMPNANYAVVVSAQTTSGQPIYGYVADQTTTYFDIALINTSSDTTNDCAFNLIVQY